MNENGVSTARVLPPTSLADRRAAAVASAVCDPGAVRDLVERAELNDQLRLAHERMKADLDAAARMQQALLPHHSPLYPGVRLAWQVIPCDELGGDLIGVFPLDDHNLGAYVLDVSGHGVGAAMLSFTLHKLLSPSSGAVSLTTRHGGSGSAPQIVPPAEVLKQLNDLFPMDPDLRQYFTLLYGVLDVRTRRFRFASAGHCPPIYVPGNGTPGEVAANGFPIGVLPDATYDEHVVDVGRGARLVLYSDGLTDVTDVEGVPFGAEGLLRAIGESAERSVDDAVAAVLRGVRAWRAGRGFQDDVSLLVLDVD